MRARWWILLLASSCALTAATTFLFCEGYLDPVLARLGGDDDDVDDDEAIEPDEQRRVAHHEAGHAIVATVLKGNDEVERITVRTTVSGGLYGVVHTRDRNRLDTAQDIMREAAVFFGGRAADKIVNGAPTNGAGSDLSHINDLVRNMHLTSGLGGSLLVRRWDEAPADVRAAVERDITSANACAEAIVTANRPVVEALAARLMEQPENDGARRLSGAAYREFLKDHPLAAVPAACTFPQLSAVP